MALVYGMFRLLKDGYVYSVSSHNDKSLEPWLPFVGKGTVQRIRYDRIGQQPIDFFLGHSNGSGVALIGELFTLL